MQSAAGASDQPSWTVDSSHSNSLSYSNEPNITRGKCYIDRWYYLKDQGQALVNSYIFMIPEPLRTSVAAHGIHVVPIGRSNIDTHIPIWVRLTLIDFYACFRAHNPDANDAAAV